MAENKTSAIRKYLTLAGSNGRFAAEFFKLPLKEKQMIHIAKINEGRLVVVYKFGDIITVRVQVQRDASRGRVAKMMYRLVMATSYSRVTAVSTKLKLLVHKCKYIIKANDRPVILGLQWPCYKNLKKIHS
jgi:hypothetical protein